MVEKLCINYGPLIGHIGSQPYYDFPPPSSLTGKNVEQKLRELGFGYRAKYLSDTAVVVNDKGLGWLDGLRNPERPNLGVKSKPAGKLVEGGRQGYRDAHEQLLTLKGVGPKVADCVALMGLGWGESVPVDTHGEKESLILGTGGCLHRLVWQIAQRDYKFGKGKHSSLTKATYDAIANKFRALWGIEAGWAHSVLFTADLRAFSERLVEKTEVVKVETVIKEEGDDLIEKSIKEDVKVTSKRIKREPDESEHTVLKVEANTERKVKRRRKV